MNSTEPRATRIAFSITELEPGGAERCLVELACRIDRGRFQPVVYCLGPRPAGNGNSLVARLEQSEIAVHFFGARRVWQAPKVIHHMRRQLLADSPRIFQAFLFHANVLGAVAARRAGVPIVLTNIRVAERRYESHLRLSRWTDRFVTRHVCVSQSVRDFMRDRGLPESKMVVIPNGVDLTRFDVLTPCSPESLGVPAGRKFLVFVGRLEEQKGLKWLFEFLPQLFAKLPNYDLVLVGDGPERQELEQLAVQKNMAGRIHFARYRADVPRIVAASEALVLPSRWEGMPNVVLEGMAAGRPIVATRAEGVCELLGADADAQSVELNDADGFQSRLLAICTNHELAGRLGAQNRRSVESHHRIETMVSAYERLYCELLASGG